MNKEEVIKILKEEMKGICRGCNKGIEECYNCPIHKLVNRVLQVLNSG